MVERRAGLGPVEDPGGEQFDAVAEGPQQRGEGTVEFVAEPAAPTPHDLLQQRLRFEHDGLAEVDAEVLERDGVQVRLLEPRQLGGTGAGGALGTDPGEVGRHLLVGRDLCALRGFVHGHHPSGPDASGHRASDLGRSGDLGGPSRRRSEAPTSCAGTGLTGGPRAGARQGTASAASSGDEDAAATQHRVGLAGDDEPLDRALAAGPAPDLDHRVRVVGDHRLDEVAEREAPARVLVRGTVDDQDPVGRVRGVRDRDGEGGGGQPGPENRCRASLLHASTFLSAGAGRPCATPPVCGSK